MKTPDRLVNHGLILGLVGTAISSESFPLGITIALIGGGIIGSSFAFGELGDQLMKKVQKLKGSLRFKNITSGPRSLS